MRGDIGRIIRSFGRVALFVAMAVFAVAAILLTIGFASPAHALPSFARQTGQPCGTCHTDFPALTPFGRRFKLLGYTTGGGEFRTTPFSVEDGQRCTRRIRQDDGLCEGAAATGRIEIGSRQGIRAAGLDDGDRRLHPYPGRPATARTDPYSPNNNVVLSPFSAFWGGAITDHVGAFAQVTYNAIGPGSLGGPVRSPHLDLGQYRRSLCQHRPLRPARFHLWHHRQQQSDRAGCVEHHAGMELPLRRIERVRPAKPRHGASRARLPRMSAASAPTPSSTTCFISN